MEAKRLRVRLMQAVWLAGVVLCLVEGWIYHAKVHAALVPHLGVVGANLAIVLGSVVGMFAIVAVRKRFGRTESDDD